MLTLCTYICPLHYINQVATRNALLPYYPQGLWRHVVFGEVAVHTRGLLFQVMHLLAIWQ